MKRRQFRSRSVIIRIYLLPPIFQGCDIFIRNPFPTWAYHLSTQGLFGVRQVYESKTRDKLSAVRPSGNVL